MITSIEQVAALPTVNLVSATSSAQQADFSSYLERALATVNSDITQADSQVQQLAVGNADSLHGVMLALENARLSLGLMVQVRNRLIEAYQDMLRMQI